eukprot:PhF_6_TR6976/c0_g1_i1/m.10316
MLPQQISTPPTNNSNSHHHHQHHHHLGVQGGGKPPRPLPPHIPKMMPQPSHSTSSVGTATISPLTAHGIPFFPMMQGGPHPGMMSPSDQLMNLAAQSAAITSQQNQAAMVTSSGGNDVPSHDSASAKNVIAFIHRITGGGGGMGANGLVGGGLGGIPSRQGTPPIQPIPTPTNNNQNTPTPTMNITSPLLSHMTTPPPPPPPPSLNTKPSASPPLVSPVESPSSAGGLLPVQLSHGNASTPTTSTTPTPGGVMPNPMDFTKPPLHTWEGPLREGHHELLCDYDDGVFTYDWYGNITNFVTATTPQMAITDHAEHTSGFTKLCYPLSSLWAFYDNPYGIEIPVNNAALTWQRPTDSLYYAPLLSAFNFVFAESQERIEHYATSPPTERAPLTQYVQQLISTPAYEKLRNARSCDFTFSSWISVLWNPIHCQHHSPQRSAGTFLTYHFINPLRCSDTHPSVNPVFSMLDLPPEQQFLRQEIEIVNQDSSRVYCSMFGLLPYRARADMWFRWLGSGMYCAPLQLVKNCNTLILQELKRTKFSGHPDFEHYVKYDRSLANFLDNPYIQ